MRSEKELYIHGLFVESEATLLLEVQWLPALKRQFCPLLHQIVQFCGPEGLGGDASRPQPVHAFWHVPEMCWVAKCRVQTARDGKGHCEPQAKVWNYLHVHKKLIRLVSTCVLSAIQDIMSKRHIYQHDGRHLGSADSTTNDCFMCLHLPKDMSQIKIEKAF